MACIYNPPLPLPLIEVVHGMDNVKNLSKRVKIGVGRHENKKAFFRPKSGG